MQNKKKKEDRFSHLDLENVNASSSMDCTGLIPAITQSRAERESYKELYDYEADVEDDN